MDIDNSKSLEHLNNAISEIRIADHMLYITYPVIKDKRLLTKALEHIYGAVICAINSILQYDSVLKRIKLSSNSNENFEVFMSKSCPRYNITPEERAEIREIFAISENHKKSTIEFTRREKVVIMADNLRTTTIDSEKLKKSLFLAKNLVNKAKFGMNIQ